MITNMEKMQQTLLICLLTSTDQPVACGCSRQIASSSGPSASYSCYFWVLGCGCTKGEAISTASLVKGMLKNKQSNIWCIQMYERLWAL